MATLPLHEEAPIVPPPWDLRGRGFMFLYHFPKAWGSRFGFAPVEARGEYVGGLGALMLVDYEQSNCGPYRELLFIPGRFRWGEDHRYAISRIWVSTSSSVASGRANWGIPKVLGEFQIERGADRRDVWRVHQGGAPVLQARFRYGRLPLPIHTRVVPLPLLQWLDGVGFLTKFSGFGLGRLAAIEELTCAAGLMPDLQGVKPLLGLEIAPFRLRFPVPTKVRA